MNKKLKYTLFAVTQIFTFLPFIAFVNNYLFNFLGVKSKWYVINVAPHVAEQVNLNGIYSDRTVMLVISFGIVIFLHSQLTSILFYGKKGSYHALPLWLKRIIKK